MQRKDSESAEKKGLEKVSHSSCPNSKHVFINHAAKRGVDSYVPLEHQWLIYNSMICGTNIKPSQFDQCRWYSSNKSSLD